MVDKNTAGVIVQNPNFFGIVEDYTELGQLLHQNKGLLIMDVNPVAMGVLKSPADMGADIVIGEGQPLGNSISFGDLTLDLWQLQISFSGRCREG